MTNGMRKIMRKSRAFTLVEMLVVITIMVMLFGIMSPVMFPAKKRAAVESSEQKLVSVMYATRARAAAALPSGLRG